MLFTIDVILSEAVDRPHGLVCCPSRLYINEKLL